MPRRRLSMRKIKEVLRLKHSGLSCRAIGRVCSIGKETVREYLVRAAESGLSWPLPEDLTEEQLEQRLFPSEMCLGGKREESDWGLLHQELRKKGVTRKLLWQEYAAEGTEVYRYTQFCERYARWVSMGMKKCTSFENEKCTTHHGAIRRAWWTRFPLLPWDMTVC